MRIIAAEGVVITLIAVLYAFIPSVSHAYWIFTTMARQVYLIMYVLLFIAVLRLRRSQPDHPYGYRAPAHRSTSSARTLGEPAIRPPPRRSAALAPYSRPVAVTVRARDEPSP